MIHVLVKPSPIHKCLPVIHKTVYALTVECSITRKHLWEIV